MASDLEIQAAEIERMRTLLAGDTTPGTRARTSRIRGRHRSGQDPTADQASDHGMIDTVVRKLSAQNAQ